MRLLPSNGKIAARPERYLSHLPTSLLPMSATISSIELYPLRIPREVPYLGPLEEENRPNLKGYIVRPGNRTVYPVHDQTLLVKAVASSGAVGWGECFGVVAPQVAQTILEELLIPFVIGRSPHDVKRIYEDLYDLQRVRGHFGGYALDAIAGLDMALWDLRGKLLGQPVWQLLGGLRHERLPVYVSGLPGATRAERAALAKSWIDRGFSALKFAAVVANQGEVAEMVAIRQAVGAAPKILVDLHWRYTALEAIQLIDRLCEYDLHLAEAPVAPEDMAGRGVAHDLRISAAFTGRLHERNPAGDRAHRHHRLPAHLRTGAGLPLPGDAARHHQHRHRPGCQPASGRNSRQCCHAGVPALDLRPQQAIHPQRNGLPRRLLYPAARARAGHGADRGNVELYD